MHMYIYIYTHRHMTMYAYIYEYVFIKHHMLNLHKLFNNLNVIMAIKIENSNY